MARKNYNNLSNEDFQKKLYEISGNFNYSGNRAYILMMGSILRNLSSTPHYIVLDTETNGLPVNYNAPISNISNWPRLVQCSFLSVGWDGKKEDLQESSYIVKPRGFIISTESTNIHGITHSEAVSKGDELFFVLHALGQALTDLECVNSKVIVGHNIEYDIKVLSAEYYRMGLPDPFENATIIDTMKESVDFCKIPGQFGYKWPKLQELYIKLFGKNFEGAHNALADVKATHECYCELKKRGIL